MIDKKIRNVFAVNKIFYYYHHFLYNDITLALKVKTRNKKEKINLKLFMNEHNKLTMRD